MNRKEKEMTAKDALEFLLSQHTGILSLVDGERPYAIPIHYAYDETPRSILFHCTQSGRKLDAIRRNPNACLTVYNEEGLRESESPCKSGTRYMSAIAEGKIEEIADAEEKAAALEVLVSHISGRKARIPPHAAENVTVLRMKVLVLSGKKDDKKS